MTFEKTIEQLKTKSLINTDKRSYTRIHNWVNRQLGKATHCSIDKTHESTRYHWANISGEYREDLSDFRQLCPSCNIKLGFTENNKEIKRLQAIGNTSHCKPVLKVYPNGSWIKYPSSKIASDITGIKRTNITNAINGWTQTAGGYQWRRVGG